MMVKDFVQSKGELLNILASLQKEKDLRVKENGQFIEFYTEEAGTFARVDLDKKELKHGLGLRTSSHWGEMMEQWIQAKPHWKLGVSVKHVFGEKQKASIAKMKKNLENFETGKEIYQQLKSGAEQAEYLIPLVKNVFTEHGYTPFFMVGGELVAEWEKTRDLEGKSKIVPLS